MCVYTEFNNLVKTHVCFHQDLSQALLRSTQVSKLSPQLALAMPAVIALPASFFVYHRVTATFWTQISSYVQLAQLQWIYIRYRIILAIPVCCCLFLFLRALLQGLHVQFKCTCDGIR